MVIKLQNQVAKFGADYNLTTLIEGFVDYYNHKQNKGMFDASVGLFAKKENIDASIEEATGKLAGIPNVIGMSKDALITNPTYIWAKFAVIGALVDAVLPDALNQSIGLYTDIRYIGFGDSATFKIEPRDLFVVTKGGHGNRYSEIKKQHKGTVTISPEFRDITVSTSLYKVLAGEEDAADFAMKAAKSLEVQMTYDAYSALTTALGNLTSGGANDLKVVGYDQQDLMRLCQAVSAWNGGRRAVVMGTPVALNSVIPSNTTGWRFFEDSSYVTLGYMKTAFGYDMLAVPQVADYKTEFALALKDTELYIISPQADKLIKGVVEGSVLTFVNDYAAHADLTQDITMKKSYGFAVATSAVAGLMTL